MGDLARRAALQLRWRFNTRLPGILLGGATISAILLSLQLSPVRGVIATVFAFLLMATPGVFIGLALFGWKPWRQPESIIFGVPIGIMISGYVALMLGYLVHWSAILIVIALLSLAGLCIPFALRHRGTPLLSGVRPWSASEFSILGMLGLVVVAFVAIPFARVGNPTPDGHAYTWLFGFDFVLRGAYAADITIGLPLDHIHMAGVPLHMYLVGYVLPALSYSLSGSVVHVQAILFVTEILLDLAFIACLLSFWRLFATSTRALLATAVVALVTYSYYGWLVIARHVSWLLPVSLATKLNKQFSFGEVSHLFQRLFMVEPQAILALCIFIFVITVMLSSPRCSGFRVSVLLGLAIGVEFGIDSWLGLTLAAWFAGMQLLRLQGHWSDRIVWLQSLLVAGIVGAIWATFFVVRMLDLSSGSLISLGPNWWGVKFGLLVYGIELGPMLPLGLIGLWSLWRSLRLHTVGLLLIAFMAVTQDLFVSIADLPRFRMGNRLLPIVLLAGTAWFFDRARATLIRKWTVLAALTLAAPTLITDIYGSSNVLDRHQTFYVSPADLKACEWVRTHLPSTAIIQGKPDYVGNHGLSPSGGEISLLPAFALRRSALGAEYAARSVCAACRGIAESREAALDSMFRQRDARSITSIAAMYDIEYLYVGPYEQGHYSTLLKLLQDSPLFESVYDRESVHIFRIVNTS